MGQDPLTPDEVVVLRFRGEVLETHWVEPANLAYKFTLTGERAPWIAGEDYQKCTHTYVPSLVPRPNSSPVPMAYSIGMGDTASDSYWRKVRSGFMKS